MTETSQLLRDYAQRGSESAFRELVSRYLDFVYSVALRRVDGDAHLAEDIAQTVFADLARQARGAQAPLLQGPCALGGWLHRHTCFVASNVRRAEQRRQTRERIAAEMNSLEQTGEPAWQHLAPVLDAAIDELGPEDRDAILLRFYERRDLRAVGAALGVSEDAAQKRVSRGVDKLRALLTDWGITLSLGVLTGILAERAVTAAPPHLAPALSDGAPVAAGVAAGAAGAGGFSALLATARAKVLVGAAALGLLLVPLLYLHHRQPRRAEAVEVATAATPTAPTAPAASGTPGVVPASSQESAAANALEVPFEGLRLTILAADSGQPVPNVTIDYRCWEGGKFTRKKLQANRLGICQVPFTQVATTQLQLTTQIEGFADTRLHWRPGRGEKIPAEYTLHLGRPVPIGGKVVDADGQAVAKAKVGWNDEEVPAGETRPENHWFGWIEVETDAEGRWSINRIAEDMIPRIYGSARHPEHAQSAFVFANREPEAEKQLRAGTHVFQLGRALVVRGVVVDSENRPVPRGKVLVGRMGESNSREATTGIDGTFGIAGCKLGENFLTAEAAGFAPTTLRVEIAENAEPFRIRLDPGKTLRLRVVSKAGQPIAGANVWYNTLEDDPIKPGENRATPVQVEFSPKTDEQGRVAWENAPDQEMAFDFQKRGYLRVNEVHVRPDGQEHQVVLPPALTIAGTVIDASTGKPVPRFRIVCGWPEDNPLEGGTRPLWSTLERFWVSFDGGTFRHSLEEPLIVGRPNPGYVFKFEAEAYAPFISRAFKPDEGEVQLAVILQPAQTATITVLLPDGRPAANADIGLVSPGAQLRLLPGGFDRHSSVSGGSILSADASGRVRLPPDEAIQKIVAVHAQGYAEATPALLRAEPMLRLQPWGRIEGTYWSGGKAAAGREMFLKFIDSELSTVSFDFEAYRVTTDAQGRFTFAKAPPVRLRLIRLVPNAQPDGSKAWTHQPLAELDVRSGETTQIELGKSDRRVVVRLRWPDGWQPQPGWRTLAVIVTPRPIPPEEIRTNQEALVQWQRRPENRAAFANLHLFPLKESDDGSWTADEVAPGNYLVRALLRDPNALAGKDNPPARFEAEVVVPDDPSGGTFDAGELPLQPAGR